MKEIELTQGQVAQVDDEDFAWLDQWNWYAFNSRGIWYAVRKPGNSPVIFMHRVIMSAPEDMTVDHIDGDGLNNQRHNLRLATRRQQQGNRTTRALSGVIGVRLRPSGRYTAELGLASGAVYLGTFDTIEEAKAAYDVAAAAHFDGVQTTSGGEEKK